MRTYDLIIIGAGPAGYVSAIRAAQLGKSVAIIEKESLGGTCLNWGCIPTKSLLHSSGLFKKMKESYKWGVIAPEVSFDSEKIYQRKDELIERLQQGIDSLLKANKVVQIKGVASFVDANTICVDNQENISATNILIATGSQSIVLDIKGIEHTLTSNQVLTTPIQAQRIAIIGGGVIGVEFASHLLNLGKSVTIYEFRERVIPTVDQEISKQLGLTLKKDGAKLKLQTQVKEIIQSENGLLKVVAQEKSKETAEEFDVIISCIGRRPYTDALSLEKIGVATNRGAIEINENMQTSIPNIYAVGDVTNKIQLAHFASAQGITAVEHICGVEPTINLNIVPSCIYVSPEIASVGITQEESDKELVVGKYTMGGNAKSMIEGLDRGFVKTIFEKDSGKIVGAHIYAAHATDMITELALAIQQGLTNHEIAHLIHPHPTVCESILESVEDSLGSAIHTMPKI
ncbi:MAG: dihydrolipoyl dehydrogenase [Bacteroidales bacterium]